MSPLFSLNPCKGSGHKSGSHMSHMSHVSLCGTRFIFPDHALAAFDPSEIQDLGIQFQIAVPA